MEGCQHHCHHYNDYAYDIIDHLGTIIGALLYGIAKVEASGAIRVHVSVDRSCDTKDSNKHRYPQYSTGNEYMNSAEGAGLLTFEVERPQAHDEDDDIEGEGHVHVDVDHGAHQLTPPVSQAPVLSCIIVNPEG